MEDWVNARLCWQQKLIGHWSYALDNLEGSLITPSKLVMRCSRDGRLSMRLQFDHYIIPYLKGHLSAVLICIVFHLVLRLKQLLSYARKQCFPGSQQCKSIYDMKFLMMPKINASQV